MQDAVEWTGQLGQAGQQEDRSRWAALVVIVTILPEPREQAKAIGFVASGAGRAGGELATGRGAALVAGTGAAAGPGVGAAAGASAGRGCAAAGGASAGRGCAAAGGPGAEPGWGAAGGTGWVGIAELAGAVVGGWAAAQCE